MYLPTAAVLAVAIMLAASSVAVMYLHRLAEKALREAEDLRAQNESLRRNMDRLKRLLMLATEDGDD